MSYESIDDVFDAARTIYGNRSEQYDADDPWGNGGWRAQLVEMRKKLDRLWTYWEADDEGIMVAEDDALDLINYTAFFLILAERGDRDGTWPWPEEDPWTTRTKPRSRQNLDAQGAAIAQAARQTREQIGDEIRQFASSLNILLHGWLPDARSTHQEGDRAKNVGLSDDGTWES